MLWLNEKQVDERKCLGFSSWSLVFCRKLSKWLILHMSLTGLDQAVLLGQFLRLLTVESDVLIPIWWQKTMKEIMEVNFGTFSFWHFPEFQISGNFLIFHLKIPEVINISGKTVRIKIWVAAIEEVTGFLSSKGKPQLFFPQLQLISHILYHLKLVGLWFRAIQALIRFRKRKCVISHVKWDFLSVSCVQVLFSFAFVFRSRMEILVWSHKFHFFADVMYL